MNALIEQLQDLIEHAGAGIKVSLLAASGLFGVLLTSDVFTNLILALAALTALVVFRLKRRFKEGPVKGLLDFLDRNIVELGLIATAVPNGWKVASEVLRNFNMIP